MLPKIICSSVIRAAQRGNSHGGIYKVDCETSEYDLLLDWNRPDIDWDGRGGDRGARGMTFYNGLLYAAAGDELFVFNKNMQIVKSFRNCNLKHTHEIWRDGRLLYIIANMFDTILVFDLEKDGWIDSWHFQTGKPVKYNPNKTTLLPTDKLHLDAVWVNKELMYYCGAHMKTLNVVNLITGEELVYQDNIIHTHNARPYKEGVIHNLAFGHKTVWKNIFGEVKEEWLTPLYKKEEMTYTDLPHDHAVQGYTRGMVIYNDYIIVGNSPATINIFVAGKGESVKSIQLSNDIRNSICGIALYEW